MNHMVIHSSSFHILIRAFKFFKIRPILLHNLKKCLKTNFTLYNTFASFLGWRKNLLMMFLCIVTLSSSCQSIIITLFSISWALSSSIQSIPHKQEAAGSFQEDGPNLAENVAIRTILFRSRDKIIFEGSS